jgi:predicted nucleic acid-binding protein
LARFIVLDSGPLGLATAPPGVPEADRCRLWLLHLEFSAAEIVIPAIADYEVRREWLRVRATAKLRRLHALKARFDGLAISNAALEQAARFWAQLRRGGLPTAGDEALDGDAILAGQAATIGLPGDVVTVASTNLRHLGRFPGIDARQWDRIT